MKHETKKLPLSLFEIVWYSLMLGLGLWGLTYIVLGLIAQYAPIPDKDNVLLEGSNAIKQAFGLGFLPWGLIILAIATVGAVVVLLTLSKKADREFEKAQRRAAIRASARKLDKAEIEQAQQEYKKEIEENRTTQEVKEVEEAVEEPQEEAKEPAPETVE